MKTVLIILLLTPDNKNKKKKFLKVSGCNVFFADVLKNDGITMINRVQSISMK